MTEKSKFADQAQIIRGRQEYLFQELTRLSDFTRTGLSSLDAELHLRSCERLEKSLEMLTNDTIALNVNLDPKSKLNLEEHLTMRGLLDSVIKNCLKVQKKPSGEKGEAKETSCNLPTLSVPIWDGDIGEWLEFKAQFESVVHSSKKLRAVTKLQYLRSSLRGEPAIIVSQYPVNDDSYELAYADLLSRYDSKRRVASYYINKLLNYQANSSPPGKEHITFLKIHRAASSALLHQEISNVGDFILFEIGYRNLSPSDRKNFDVESGFSEIPTMKDLLDFVEKRAMSEEIHLDNGNNNFVPSKGKLSERHFQKSVKKSLIVAKGSISCFCCKGNHKLFNCPELLSLPVADRKIRVEKIGCCVACLYRHPVEACRSKYACKFCGSKKHNTILHEDPSVKPSNSQICNSCVAPGIGPSVLLGTIRCRIWDNWGNSFLIRAVLDPGSEISVITSSLADRLGLPRSPATCQVEGVGRSLCRPLGNVQVKIGSVNDNTDYQFIASILPKICDTLPKTKLSVALREKFRGIKLADPSFCEPDKVQLLLGAGAYSDLLSTEEPSIIPGNPVAVRTKFGYVITGRTESTSADQPNVANSLCLSTCPLDEGLRRFWEIEEVRQETPPNPADVLCEQHFMRTHERDPSGRFVVRLPFLPDTPPLGNNEEMALKRLRNLERRLGRNPSLSKAYNDCLQEYIKLDHISVCNDHASYLLPHHAVIKQSSTTTKCRVVFDCSAPDDKGLSLNDRLYRGPPLLNDISLLLMNFRQYKFCFMADIKMMYRMVAIHPDDRKYLIIAWGNQKYQMNRLPFGLKPAGYIAGRCLIQLSQIYQKEFPLAAKAIQKNRYADDFCIGAQTMEEANRLIDQLTKLLAKGGFEIRRWSSNTPEVLSKIPEDFRETPTTLPSGESGVKVLGVMWDHSHDAFVARVIKFDSEIISKRSVLSYVAKIYDVMGFFSPAIFPAKHFFQRLWLLQIDWDEPLPPEFANEWKLYAADLMNLSDIKIPRFLPVSSVKARLVGFSDASEKGMAAAVYIQWQCAGEIGEGRLLTSKTKLAPLKTLTIPRLELCAALLLTKLMKPIIEFSEKKFESINLYTDSTIVLAWLKHPLHELKIFVCHRISEIRQIIPTAIWGHVSSPQNPADLGSRGVSSDQLKNSSLWWNGPSFLSRPYHEWPVEPINPCPPDQVPEKKDITTLNVTITEPVDHIIRRFSSLTRMQRVLAYIFRFANKTRKESKISGPLTTEELENALLTAVRLSQKEEFGSDVQKIKDGKPLGKGLSKLSPFFDQKCRLVRVGGRLGRADFLPENARHPFLLSGKGHLSTIICDYYHKRLLHSGPRTTCAAIQRKFWITSLMSLVKKRIHKCATCRLYNAKPNQPLMADVLPGRMEKTYCWSNCAMDFGGPFPTRESRARKSPIHKSYMCVFVCLTTRAIHLELVTELTSSAFLAAFQRFTARRSVPQTIYSDRGTNFVGARSILKECKDFLIANHDELFAAAAAVGTRWLLNVPYGPNFNGCAENGIKSAKSLIKRQVGDQVLTLEEFSTLLCRIEQVLNSRPISFSSLDINDRDLVYLTPGHFIVGREMMTPPEITVEENITVRDRWRSVQQMSQSFWKIWSTAYLHELMQRGKWNKSDKNIQVGDVVYIKELKTSPLSWPIGRVVEALPGVSDGTVRVARVRVRGKDLVRPCNKLIPIPTDS